MLSHHFARMVGPVVDYLLQKDKISPVGGYVNIERVEARHYSSPLACVLYEANWLDWRCVRLRRDAMGHGCFEEWFFALRGERLDLCYRVLHPRCYRVVVQPSARPTPFLLTL